MPAPPVPAVGRAAAPAPASRHVVLRECMIRGNATCGRNRDLRASGTGRWVLPPIAASAGPRGCPRADCGPLRTPTRRDRGLDHARQPGLPFALPARLRARRRRHPCTPSSATPRPTPPRCSAGPAKCHDEGVALGGLPGADALRLLDRGHPAAGRPAGRGRGCCARVVAASADLLPVLVVGAPAALPASHLQRRRGHPPRRCLVSRPSRIRHLPRFYERRQIAPGDDERGTIRVAGVEVPFGPDLLFEASDVPGFVLHVEICEDMFVPIPPSAEAALAGATVLANLSGSPITIGRAESARCSPGRRHSAAWPPTCMPLPERESRPPTWRGTARRWSGRTVGCSPESERFPKGERLSVADSTSSCCVRSG